MSKVAVSCVLVACSASDHGEGTQSALPPAGGSAPTVATPEPTSDQPVQSEAAPAAEEPTLAGGGGNAAPTEATGGASTAGAGGQGSENTQSSGGAGGASAEPIDDVFSSIDFKGFCRMGVPTEDGETDIVELGKAYDVTAIGTEIGHHCGEDQGRFVYMELSGDFDVSVQLAHMDNFGAQHFRGHSAPVKAGLSARVGLDEGDMYVGMFAASPDEHYPDAFHFDHRPVSEGSLFTDEFHYGYLNSSSSLFDRQLPDIYVRLQRQGNTIRGFASRDGEEWVSPEGRSSYEVDWPETIYVGLTAASAPEGFPDAESLTHFRNVSGFPSGPAE